MSVTSTINRSVLHIAEKNSSNLRQDNLSSANHSGLDKLMGNGLPRLYEQTVLDSAVSDFLSDTQTNLDKLTNALHQAFGDKASPAQIDQLAASIIAGDIPLPQSIAFVNAGTLGDNVSGVYINEEGGKILLDVSLLNDSVQLQRVFNEELGHHFDAVLGGPDSAGDEGAIFAESLIHGTLSKNQLLSLRSENDVAVINLNGRIVQVEQYSYSGPGSSPGTGGSPTSSSSSSGYSGPGSSLGAGGMPEATPTDEIKNTGASARHRGGWSNMFNGAVNLGSNTVSGIRDAGADALNAIDESTKNLRKTIVMTFEWITGTGPDTRVFTDDSMALALQDANVTNQARDFWYQEVNAGRKTITDGVTNFRGEQRFGGGNFGLGGLWDAGLDPVEQYVGSFGVEMTSDGQSLTYTMTNNSSVESFAYGIGPEYERSTFGPGGNMRQTYEFSESIDASRLQP